MNTLTADKRYNFCVNYADNQSAHMKHMHSAQLLSTPETAHREMRREIVELARRRCLVMSSYVYEERPYVTR